MSRIVIVGDGPAGLSAALFLAKNGHDAVVVGQDDTPMHYALLHNYLGLEEEPGPEFQSRARAQVRAVGATLTDAEVTAVTSDDDGLRVTLADGADEPADYVVLAAGKRGLGLARGLGTEIVDGAVAVDADQRTDVDRVYAVGRLVRPRRSQAIISAGAGAIAALDILAREAGDDVTDWDSLDH